MWRAHPTACIDDGAEIGPGTRIWHFAHVMAGARIGRDCVLGQNVFVASGVRLGDGVRVQNNVSIYAGVELDDLVFCGPSVVFTNVRTPRAHLRRNTPAHFAPTRVRRGATLGANATVVCGVEIGAWAMVGAGAVVTHDVPPHALVLGTPARLAGFACVCGESLAWGASAARLPHAAEPDQARCSGCDRTWHHTDATLTCTSHESLP